MRRNKILFCVGIFLVLFVVLMPMLYALSGSFHQEHVIKSGHVRLIPTEFTLENYKDLLTNTTGGTQAYVIYIKNSLIVAIGTCVLSLCISVLAAYGLARYHLPFKETIAKVMLFLYVFPTILSIYPIYSILAKLHLTNTYLGLILVHTALVSPFCTWFLRSFFATIPIEIEEAARVDGANNFHIIIKILLPLTSAGLLAAGMYSMIYSWGEMIFASILIDSASLKTTPIALAGFMDHGNQRWGLLLAGSVLNILPLMIAFIPFLKNFLKGFMEGAVKG